MSATVEPFDIAIPEAALDDLRERLARARFAPDFANDDWAYGTEREYLRELVAHWRDGYDWRVHERAMNEQPNFRTEIDGIPIHFVHARGAGPSPLPLVMSHGWPWSGAWEFHKVVDLLADPGAHGGDPADAFDVVVPTLPGFGFSTPLTTTGQNFWTTADLWSTLMRDVLGYERYAAHGGDWGGVITGALAHKHADELVGIHLTTPAKLGFASGEAPYDLDPADFDDTERAMFERIGAEVSRITAHWAVHTADPQTLAFALHDSPVGLCSWLLERRRHWSDCDGDVERRFSKDELLTNASLYWLTDSFATSARYYYEGIHNPWAPSYANRPTVDVPTGVLVMPADISMMPRKAAEQYYDLRRWTVAERGGHFAPMEEPEALVEDLRAFFRPLRG
jgi:pimeloyl-ACP methyl ester carboxylesterase